MALSSHFTALRAIDSHTAGEPTRLIIEGFPDLGSGSMAERKARFAQDYDDWRSAIILEPRGNDVLVGALLCQPCSPQAAAGVIFFNNAGYLGMCGHGTIGLVASLAYLGRIGVGDHLIETPVGTVNARLHEDGSVTVENVPAYRYRRQVRVEVSGYGPVVGDIAWGGNWFFLIGEHHLAIDTQNLDALTAFVGWCGWHWSLRGFMAKTAGLSIISNCLPPIRRWTAVTSCFARAKPMTAHPAGPAPAPNWPVWRPTANCNRVRSGARRA